MKSKKRIFIILLFIIIVGLIIIPDILFKSYAPSIESTVKGCLRGIQSALCQYYCNESKNEYPANLAVLCRSGYIGCNVLTDVFENPYNYEPIYNNKEKIDDYKLWSSGKDGIPNTKDDIYAPLNKEERARLIQRNIKRK